MPADKIVRSFDGSAIHQRVADGYINLNQMANATGKRIDNWLRLQETRNLIAEFDVQQETVSSDLRKRFPALLTIRGGKEGGSTWGHPDIAIQFAQWCSPTFALQVSRWVREWMTTGRNPLADIDRVTLRDGLKDRTRVEMTNEVKHYLEEIRRYDDQKFCGLYFARVHDAINIAITSETAKQMRNRLSAELGKPIKESDLIRDYFPTDYLHQYIAVCQATANVMSIEGLEPLAAVEKAVEYVLSRSYHPTPINFVEHIESVRRRLSDSTPIKEISDDSQ
jgi:hypothetical protein